MCRPRPPQTPNNDASPQRRPCRTHPGQRTPTRTSAKETAINLNDRGSATLWGVALMGLLMAIALALATVGSVRVARHRADSAADLSALAAARLALIDPEGACARAAELATSNGVELTKCEITDDVADVWTALPISLPLLGTRSVAGRSRAGPANVQHSKR
ncbi:Rv3654c family TadE-like protein [Nonomuraea sp. NPDC004297]